MMDEDTLKKIKLIMDRTKLSEDKAKELLDKYQGDVIEALIHYEREKEKNKNNFSEKISESEFIAYIKELIKNGNVARIIIRKEETVLVNIPVNAGIVVGIAMLLNPVLVVLGAATAVVTNLEVDIIKKDGSVEVVNKIVKNGVETGTKVVSEVGYELKEIFHASYDKVKDKIHDIKRKH